VIVAHGRVTPRYEKQAVVELEGEPALAAYTADPTRPSYFILLAWEAGRVQLIRDFRYVSYIADDAEYLVAPR
jgi:hypothetical protein